MITGLIALMGSAKDIRGPINLGNPEEITIRELANLIVDLTGSRSKIVHQNPPEDDPRQRRPDISEAQRCLNWVPTVGLKDGLRPTIAYFERLLTEGAAPGFSTTV
jgi:UDP-glucuronate decarboxylase